MSKEGSRGASAKQDAVGRTSPAGAWTTLSVLCAVSIFNYMDRMLLAAVSQPLKVEFSLSDTQLGLLTGVAFALFYASMGIPMGRLTDRVSRKRLLAACLGCWSLMTALTGFAANYIQLLIARMLIAVGESGCTPAAYSLVADNFAPRQRNFALGLFNGASMLGVIAGFVLGGWISEHYGWRSAFYFLGLPGLLLAVIVLVVMREPVRGATDLRVADAAPPTRIALRMLLGDRSFVMLLLAISANSIGVYGITQWMPQFYIRTHGLSLSQVGIFFGVAFGLGMFIGNLLGGAIGARLGVRSIGAPLWLSVIASLSIIPLYVGALLVSSSAIAIALTFGAAVIGAAANPPSVAASQNLPPSNVRGTAASLALLVTAVGGIGLGPLLIGMASDALTPR